MSKTSSAPISSDDMKWLDFYSLLSVSQDADEGTLRSRIREAYLEAIRNSDHRQVERRLHFQVMSQRIIPQARRILLEDRTRRAYDRQLERHRHGDTHAVPYTVFVTQLTRIEAGEDPFEKDALPTTQETGDEAITKIEGASLSQKLTAENTQALLDNAHQTLLTEEKYAEMSPIPTLTETSSTRQTHDFFVLDMPLVEQQPDDTQSANVVEAKNVADAKMAAHEVATTSAARKTSAESQPKLENPLDAKLPYETTQAANAQFKRPQNPVVDFAPEALPSVAEAVAPLPERAQGETLTSRVTSPKTFSRVLKASEVGVLPEEPSEIRAHVLRADGTPVSYEFTSHSAVDGGIDELGAHVRGIVTSKRENDDGTSRFATRVNIDEVSQRAANAHRFRHGQRVLSQRALTALMALTAACLMFVIWFQLRALNVAPPQPLRIVYASALQPVMDSVARDFLKKNPDVQIELRPMDARDAMQAALTTSTRDGATMGTDIWIPSESLWSDRFNAVAAQYRQRPLAGSRSLALSPLILVVRSDRAQSLRRRFPNRIISSWSGLREAIARDANGHFGLADPQKSGSGALARYFMAREWCAKNGVAWDAKGVKNEALWKWLGTVENNVPSYARLTGEMAKDLALGNANRYWWAIVYESDAMGWIKRGQNVEVFYLPQTAYADHPFCAPERTQMSPEIRQARGAFETYLRSDLGQKVLLQNGFRPAEISLSKVPNNPFNQPLYKRRGVRTDGFRVDERINYRTLNSLTAQWGERF